MTMLPWPRKGAAKRTLPSGIRIEIYARSDRFGTGVAISVFMRGIERRRYDLLAGAAHMHVQSEPGQPRRYFPDGKTVAEYLELALADLASWRPIDDATRAWVREMVALRAREEISP